jgi:hypothetical protein
MNKSVFLLIFTLLCVTSSNIFAQKYQTAGGIRIGSDVGLTIKQHIGDNWTVEAMGTTKSRDNESRLTLLAAKHFNFLGRGLNMYAGGGLHKGFLNEVKTGYSPTFGLSTIAGMEATMGRYNFSIDLRPTYNFQSGAAQDNYNTYLGLSARYIFVPRESRFQTWKSKQKERFKRKKT